MGVLQDNVDLIEDAITQIAFLTSVEANVHLMKHFKYKGVWLCVELSAEGNEALNQSYLYDDFEDTSPVKIKSFIQKLLFDLTDFCTNIELLVGFELSDDDYNSIYNLTHQLINDLCLACPCEPTDSRELRFSPEANGGAVPRFFRHPKPIKQSASTEEVHSPHATHTPMESPRISCCFC